MTQNEKKEKNKQPLSLETERADGNSIGVWNTYENKKVPNRMTKYSLQSLNNPSK